MQRTLVEIDLTSKEISERLLTLECGHIFTLETLDGHCHMTDYYEVDAMGVYLTMKSPPTEFQQPPTCPTCRTPITARRYGRVIKRANLDILEQNVASNMTKSLEDVGPLIQDLSSGLPALETSAKALKFEPVAESATAHLQNDLRAGKADEVLPPSTFTSQAMVKNLGLSASEAKAWFTIVRELHQVYKKVAKVASTRSSHVRAYEAALSTLYRLEMAALADDPVGSLTPEPLAMQNVNRKIGQPPHKADRRYHLEAFLLSVELRFMFGQIARARLETLLITSNDPEERVHRLVWSTFIEFIYQSCEDDCRKAVSIADSSSASRLAARSAALLLCAEFEHFRFTAMERRNEIMKHDQAKELRDSLLNDLKTKKTEMRNFLEKIEGSYVRSRPSANISEMKQERKWFNENCRVKVERCLKEFEDLEGHIRNGTLYQPISMQEKEDIVKAFGFSHRGHFYNCANGHTFVITEVGRCFALFRRFKKLTFVLSKVWWCHGGQSMVR